MPLAYAARSRCYPDNRLLANYEGDLQFLPMAVQEWPGAKSPECPLNIERLDRNQ
jgi:hypothetical protein